MESIIENGSWIPPLLALFVAIGGTWWVQRSTGAREITEATKALLEPMTARIEKLEGDKEEAEEKLQEQQAQLDKVQKVAEDNHQLLLAANQQLADEKKERAKDRRRLTALEKWAKALRDQVMELGGQPVQFRDFHEELE